MEIGVENFLKESFDDDEFDQEDWDSITQACKSLGAKKPKDLKHLTAQDFIDCEISVVLARKLISGISAKFNSSANNAPLPTPAPSPTSTSSPPSQSSTLSVGLDSINDLAKIDWASIGHQELLESLKRMNAKELAKICNIVSEQLVRKNQGKNLHLRDWLRASASMAEKYPIHFLDNLMPGCKSFDFCKNKLSTHGDYITRGTNPRKRLNPQLADEEDGERRKKQKSKADEYGCIEWSTKELPPDETLESLTEHQKSMIAMNKDPPSSQNQEKAITLMDKCYGPIRDDLNKFLCLSSLKSNWPFLFSTRAAELHFKRLMGIDSFESVRKFAADKSDMLLNFLKTDAKEAATTEIIKIENEAKLAWNIGSGNDGISTGCRMMIALASLAIYFGENAVDHIIVYKKVKYFKS
jgi:hypothetical protein